MLLTRSSNTQLDMQIYAISKLAMFHIYKTAVLYLQIL